MSWSTPVDRYCERTDPSFWAEPVNAITNAAFLIAAAAALVDWRGNGGRDLPALGLIGIVAAIGAGSFTFHTVATRAAALLDVLPITAFIYGYLLLALRRFLDLRPLSAFAILAGFVAFSLGLSARLPPGFLNGSGAYLPALAAMLAIGWLDRRKPPGRTVLAATVVFAISLLFRTIDNLVCDAVPLGTHFLWHASNAVVLYLLLRAAMTAGDAGSAAMPRVR
jgi:hypothetical protein